jgi:RNA polymerase sigma-70 factor (ECF subfamily)
VIEKYIQEYGQRLFYLCLKLERNKTNAEELYQETWIRVLKNIGSYKAEFEFYPWVTMVCVNCYRNLMKKRAFESLFLSFTDNDAKDSYLESIAHFDPDTFENDDLVKALRKLDDRLRLVIVLYYYERYTLDEIAKITGIKLGTVKSRLYNGRMELRGLMEHERER